MCVHANLVTHLWPTPELRHEVVSDTYASRARQLHSIVLVLHDTDNSN